MRQGKGVSKPSEAIASFHEMKFAVVARLLNTHFNLRHKKTARLPCRFFMSKINFSANVLQ